MGEISYTGKERLIQRIIEELNRLEGGSVEDVKVNGTSVVDAERVANIDLSDYTTEEELNEVLENYVTDDSLETALSEYSKTEDLADVALSGDYDDLIHPPFIPSQPSDIGAIASTEKGSANGVATLDSSGKVPTTQLPSYVDDVVEGYYYNDNFYEDSAHTELITPETSKIYVDLSTDTCYRWGGSAYVEISGGAVQSDWNQNDSSQLDYIKNKPTINDAKLTINQNGTLKGEFTANDSGDVTVNLTDTTYESKAAASGGTDESLVLTGEKYTWNNKAETSDITSAINDLDVASTSIGAGETLATIKEENGKIAVTKQNIKIGLGQIDNFYRCGTNNAISGSNTWHKVASVTCVPGTNEDDIILLSVMDTYLPDTTDYITDAGILYCRIRQATSGGVDSVNYAELKFVANSGLNPSNFRLYHKTDTNGITFEIWTSMNRRYAWRKFSVISQCDRTSAYSNSWTLYNTTSPTSAPTESATCVRVECKDNTYKQTDNNILGAKNLLPINTTEKSHTQNNVQFTLNEDGSIKAHITGTGNGGQFDVTTKADENLILLNGTYIFSGCPSGGSSSTYRCRVRVYNITTGTESSYGFDTGSGVTVTVNETEGKGIIEIACLIYSGYNGSDLLFKPMIRPSSIADDTYTPPAQTNRQLTTDKVDWNDYAKNLIPYPWSTEARNGRVNRGITFTYDEEGYVTLNGTADTSNQPYMCFTLATDAAAQMGNGLVIEGNKKYTLSIDRTDDRLFAMIYIRNTSGASASVATRAIYEDGTVRELTTDFISLLYNSVFHKKVTFEILASGSYRLQTDLRVNNNSGTYTNAKGRVMLRYGEIVDDTWEKYAISNYELTAQKFDWSAQNVVGSKNILPYPYTEVFDSGLTVTYNNDGSVKISCTSQTGTKLVRLQNRGRNTRMWLDPTRRYKLSCITDKKSTASKSCGISLIYYNGSSSVQSVSAYANVSDMVVNAPSTTPTLIECYLYISANTVLDNETFYPMVRNAEVTDNTWMPYADTNRNLSMNKADVSQIATVELKNTASKSYDVGDYMVWKNKLHIVRLAISSGDAITSGQNVEATDIGSEVKKSKIWGNENIATIPNSSSSSKVYVTTSAYATEIYVQRMNIRSTSLGINETGYCSVTIPILPSMTNNYFVFMFRGDVDNKLYDGRLLFKKDSHGVYGYVSKVYQDGVLKSANDLEADIVVFEKS